MDKEIPHQRVRPPAGIRQLGELKGELIMGIFGQHGLKDVVCEIMINTINDHEYRNKCITTVH